MACRIGIVSRLIFAAFLLCAGIDAGACRKAGGAGDRQFGLSHRAGAAESRRRRQTDVGYAVVARLFRGRRRRPGRPRQGRLRRDLARIRQGTDRRRRRAVLLRRPWRGDAWPQLSGAGRCPSGRRRRCFHADGRASPASSTRWKNPAPGSTWCCSTPAATIRSGTTACVRQPAVWRKCRRRSGH